LSEVVNDPPNICDKLAGQSDRRIDFECGGDRSDLAADAEADARL